MNSSYKRIILVTDTSKFSESASQTALDLAKQHSASLLVVDTVRRPSMLSHWISSNADDMFELVANQKQERLDSFVSVFKEAGIETTTKLLIGNSSEEIARTAITENADLVIRYPKGINSRMPGPFGTTARNLMRVCPCPLLLVAEGKPVSNPKSLACINAEHKQSENESILAESRKITGVEGKWEMLYCWDFYGNEYMAGYINDEMMRQYMSDSERNFRSLFEKFLSENELSLDDANVHMEQGDPVGLIPEFCTREAIDVVVMSSASQNHPLHRLLGSTVERLLDNLPCSLLVVKPKAFESPLKPANSDFNVKN